jgi:hypothetical protein
LHRVYLFYTPYSWANNLDQIFTHDYFCGYFHNPSLIWEIWRLKHDTNLLGAHVARMLLPNIMAFNSYINRGQSYFGVPTTVVSAGPQEPMSEVSVYYLRKIRRLCRDQGISLAILPAPCFGTEAQFATVASAYDTRIHLYDPQLFVADHIHLKKAAIDPVRRQVVEEFHLRELR